MQGAASGRLRAALAAARAAETDPVGFWSRVANDVHWFSFPPLLRGDLRTKDADEGDRGGHRDTAATLGLDALFTGGKLNTGYLCSDFHVEQGRGDRTALLFESPMARVAPGDGGVSRTMTYRELANLSSSIAGGLADLGVKKGDRVVVYMPSTPEAAATALACAKLGAIHSIVFGGFAPSQLASRISLSMPRAIVTTRYAVEGGRTIPYKPLVDEAIEILDSGAQPPHVLVIDREDEGAFGEKLVKEVPCPMRHGRDHFWRDMRGSVSPIAQPAALDAADVLYTLYTSGTTATPKGIQRLHGGHAVSLKYSMESIMGCGEDDVYWAAADIGWVVAHSYLIYAPLLHGCSSVIYEGKPVHSPDAAAWWRIIEKHAVKKMFAAPSGVRAIIKEDPTGSKLLEHDLSSLEAMFLAGERLDPATRDWLKRHLPQHVECLDQWWQTETGWAIASNPYGRASGVDPIGAPFPTKPGSAGVPSPGFNVRILDDAGKELGPGCEGNIALKLPLPPGCATSLFQDNDGRYEKSYLSRFPGYYDTGDGGLVDGDGFVHVLGRNDDVLTISGHRLSTGSLEAAVSKHPQVAECAVIGIHDTLKTEVPVCFVVLKKTGDPLDMERIERELKLCVRREVSSIASIRKVVFVNSLPKTRSGKIVRRCLRDLTNADRSEIDVPATIENASVVDELAEIISNQAIGPYNEKIARQRSAEAVHTRFPSGFDALLCGTAAGGEGVQTELVRLETLDSLPAQDPAASVTVAVSHSGLNYKDGIVLSGRPGVATQFPIVPGIDFVGEVIESGPGSSGFSRGDRVVLTGHYSGQHVSGGLAEVCRVNSDWLISLEDTGLTEFESMAVGTAGFTAMQAVDALERAGLRASNPTPVLVTGAGGGVGSYAVSVLSKRGYQVVASTGRVNELREYLSNLGAFKVVGRLPPSERPLQPEEFAACVDTVGSSLFASVMPRMAYGGLVASCGNAGGSAAQGEVGVFPLILRGVNLIGIDSVQLGRSDRLRVWSRFKEPDWRPDIAKVVSATVRLDEVPGVVPELMSGNIRGRVVVRVRPH